MHILKFILTFIALCGFSFAHAGMTWTGVSVDSTLIQQLRTDEKLLEKTLYESPKDQTIYLDKAWHGIHFLLTNNAGATETIGSKVIFGGESVGPDYGYGQPQLLTPTEVKQIAQLLEKETPERLAARYIPVQLEKADIYPTIIWVREGNDALKYVLQFYNELVKFYAKAAKEGKAVVFVIS